MVLESDSLPHGARSTIGAAQSIVGDAHSTSMTIHFANRYAPSGEALTPLEVAQIRKIIGLAQGVPNYGGPVTDYLTDSARYDVIADGVHRYDAWIIGGWQPFVVFPAGGTEVLAWWSDQDSSTEEFPDADAVYAAYEKASG
jgi:hypothetical protein